MEQMHKFSASAIQLFLKGVDYPANKQKLLQAAKTNGAPQNVIDVMNKLPDRSFNQANEVEEAFGQIK